MTCSSRFPPDGDFGTQARALVCHGNAQTMNCKRSDREALMDFKTGLDDPEHWLSTVVMERKQLLSMAGMGLRASVGRLDLSLTKLKSLKHLDLSFNTFNGTIPDLISTFENLQYLNLSNAGFSGAFPANFGNLSILQVLDVSSNFLGLTVNSLEWVTSLVSLKYLEMTGANLSAVGLGWEGARISFHF
ncbi:hypothetical protein H0E87_001533 [Populus deltoides]|uniref:Uncharacterized protein n=1 Tax=Populus deltoides TaxID=3696 RepID=A0A8T2ZRA8_POPDE|nr:hypothetical protein H0E87_001533 [Populus deltoides]